VNATGLAMLFSAGTFLYVATVHVLPELTSRSAAANGCHSNSGLSKNELIVLVVGTLLPTLLAGGHHH